MRIPEMSMNLWETGNRWTKTSGNMSLLNIYFVSILFFSFPFIETADKSAVNKKMVVLVLKRIRVGVAYKVCKITLLFFLSRGWTPGAMITKHVSHTNFGSLSMQNEKKMLWKKHISISGFNIVYWGISRRFSSLRFIAKPNRFMRFHFEKYQYLMRWLFFAGPCR